jgi:hypothetical protein
MNSSQRINNADHQSIAATYQVGDEHRRKNQSAMKTMPLSLQV